MSLARWDAKWDADETRRIRPGSIAPEKQLPYTACQEIAILETTMNEAQVSIGQVKRDISELVNRVAFGGERVILTSRGKPKAVLVSLEGYERIQQANQQNSLARWQAWQDDLARLHTQIIARRGGEPIDVTAVLQADRAELETRDDQLHSD
jgi:prevent-host-death family protein